MAMQLSKQDVQKIAKRATSLQSKAKNAMDKAEGVIGTAVRTVEVTASAFGFGLLQGRYGGIEVMGVPIDLGAGLAGHAAAFVMDGDMSPHLHAFADGALATFSATMGASAGEAWYERSLTEDQRKTLEAKRKELNDAKRSAGIRGMGMSDQDVARFAGR